MALKNLLNEFPVNAGLLDYSIDWEVFLKLLLNWDEIFLIESSVGDGAFMLLVEDE